MFSKKINCLQENYLSTSMITLTHEHYFHYIRFIKQRSNVSEYIFLRHYERFPHVKY